MQSMIKKKSTLFTFFQISSLDAIFALKKFKIQFQPSSKLWNEPNILMNRIATPSKSFYIYKLVKTSFAIDVSETSIDK